MLCEYQVYANTPFADAFMIYHDHLSIMWEHRAIAYLKEIDWYDRFIKITGSNNLKVVKYYRDSVVGDSPENARALDSYGFSDLENSIKFHVAMTAALLPGDKKKFQSGTPNLMLYLSF